MLDKHMRDKYYCLLNYHPILKPDFLLQVEIYENYIAYTEPENLNMPLDPHTL